MITRSQVTRQQKRKTWLFMLTRFVSVEALEEITYKVLSDGLIRDGHFSSFINVILGGHKNTDEDCRRCKQHDLHANKAREY